ncbi:IclR family transcriptional regulator [Variovorax sp. YR216]|uniref:IclR family transcriptional regulator n=1 Tax=Variovorax sp. YR216 TaxID=1882828 RepID=UPI00089ACCF0|nr:IclR family transcriptional regulator [Variovorax sp. YR216]SEB08900.1 transcriptional regulator, IclR family [Variovorax sp. YR216]
MNQNVGDSSAQRSAGRVLDVEKPGLSAANRSLERGIEILRAFRPGAALLGNAELAERTGLPKATVTRLTQTLVGIGMLQPDPPTRAYRLAPGVLSLAHSMRSGSAVLSIASPLMRATAEANKINVGLAAPDRDEMVYLESIRYNRRPSLRSVVSGQRVPMELTSLGRAYLYSAPEPRRKALLGHFRRLRRTQWRTLGPEIEASLRCMEESGYCAASWQAEVVAVATSLVVHGAHYALNVSVSTLDPFDETVRELATRLLALKAGIERALDLASDT